VQQKSPNRKYYFNNEFFNDTNSEIKAYWLGFFYADGYILSNEPALGCALKANDKGHLEKFLNEIEINTLDCLKYSACTNSYRFQLNDKELYKSLIALGFTSKKSYDNNDRIFNLIPDKYKKDFIRGLWDGDGYVSISAEGKNITGIISNNDKLLQAISNYICNIFNDKDFCKVSYSDGYPRIRLSCVKAKKLCDYLYKNSHVYLDRKYSNYLQLKEPQLARKQYKYIKKLPSKRYYIYIPIEGKKTTIGTFDTVKDAIEAYNKKAEEYGKEKQIYIDERLEREES
jgi:hypothetical protein